VSTPLIKSRSFTPPLIQSRSFTPPLIKSRSFTPPLIQSREGSVVSLSPLGGEASATAAAKKRPALKKSGKPSPSSSLPR
jgi:hypothetical protein